ncbi:MAG: beta-N-acetylhexosaminidase, partial [Christensenellaceae bacterium]|nr:beta-N-acetylhexosaminidase [Christensenellaceae bacterium]
SCGEAAVRFVEAGGDMVLIGKYIEKQMDVFESLYEALESGRLTRERLEESVYRIIRLKQKVAV